MNDDELARTIAALRAEYAGELPGTVAQMEDLWRRLVAAEIPSSRLAELARMAHSITGSGTTFGLAGASRLLARGALRAEVDAAPASERLGILLTQLRALLAQVLGFTSLTQIDPHSGLFDLGIDSLSALETKTRLEVALSVKLAPSALMEHATPEALALHLHDEVLGYVGEPVRAESNSEGTP